VLTLHSRGPRIGSVWHPKTGIAGLVAFLMHRGGGRLDPSRGEDIEHEVERQSGGKKRDPKDKE
jgi:hypothetical protein